MNKPKYDKWWRIKYHLLGIIPTKCPYCNGEIIPRGFERHNRRYQCRNCNEILVTDYGL